MKRFQRFIAFLLAVAMVCQSVPNIAVASEPIKRSEDFIRGSCFCLKACVFADELTDELAEYAVSCRIDSSDIGAMPAGHDF